MDFCLHIGIDYSGAQKPTARLKGLQVYVATDGMPDRVPPPVAAKGRRPNWCRREIAEWLIEQARSGRRFIVGIDHAFSFPEPHFRRYGLASWPEFPEHFVEHWPTHEPHGYVDLLREGRPQRTSSSDEFRLCERWTSSAKSVFRFDCQGQVAKSTHAGIPWLWHIRREVGDLVHFWPFDGWEAPTGRSVIAEAYPSIFRSRYPREDRSPDQQDAYSVARWLIETCENDFLERYLDPPLTPEERGVAMLEGWILGVA